MYDTASLLAQLTGTIGLYPALSANGVYPAAQSSPPVAYLSDAHKLLRQEILSAMGPNLSTSVADPYNADVPYPQYSIVQDNGVIYESTADDNQGQDLADRDYWKQTTDVSAWYSRIERGAIGKLARAINASPPSTALLNRQPIFNREGNAQGVLTKTGRFLAWRFWVANPGVLVNLARVGLQVTGTLTNMPLYLFRSESSQPIATIQLSGNTINRTIWIDSKAALAGTKGGYFLLGYFEADLPTGVQAIGSERGFTPAGCSACGGPDAILAQGRQPYVRIESVYVQSAPTSGVMTWGDETVVNRQTWGLNAIIEAYCDRSQALVNALLNIIACDVLEEISTSDRVNAVTAQMKSQAYVALYGQATSKDSGGLAKVRDKAISDLKGALASSDCLKVEAPRKGLSFASMYD